MSQVVNMLIMYGFNENTIKVNEDNKGFSMENDTEIVTAILKIEGNNLTVDCTVSDKE